MTKNRMRSLYGIGALIGAVCWTFIVFKLVEPLDRDGLRAVSVGVIAWLMPILIIAAIVVTRLLSVNEIRAHDKGLDKALDKVAGMGERVAQTRVNMVTSIKRPADVAPSNAPLKSDYLPAMRLRAGDPDKPIEM